MITVTDFLTWKGDLEKTTVSSFFRNNIANTDGSKIEYFFCNRSGNYKTKATGKRKLKSQGTLKINQNCTASIKAQINVQSGAVHIHVCHTHYGHENQLCHIRIPTAIKETIAGQLLQGVQPQRILHDVRSSCMTPLQRKHLTTKKDILNIAKHYGIEKIEKHSKDHISIEAYVQEHLNDGTGTILLYKRQTEETLAFPPTEKCTLQNEDFALGVMTDFQKEMIKKFGNDIICLDGTHGTNAYDFKLITVLVIDEFGEGIPVAWLLCNKEDGIALTFFFKQVLNAVGSIKPRVIMSDKAPQYYNSWVSVFGGRGETRKLLCIWHVHHDWQKRVARIPDKEVASALYKGLCIILEERDPATFEKLLLKSIDDMKNNHKTEEFADYFEKEWAKDKTEWALCYRVGCGINTNMYLESFHKTFKYSYLHGKHNKRLDKCFVMLLTFERDLASQRLIKLEKGKTTWKASQIHKRHMIAEKLTFNLITQKSNNEWAVSSARSVEADTNETDCLQYTVEQQLSSCKESCPIQCTACKICIHMFSCSCPDAIVRSMICKHIHLVARFISKPPEDMQLNCPDHSNSNDITFPDQPEDMSPISRPKNDTQDKEFIIRNIQSSPNDINSLKESAKQLIASLSLNIEMCSNENALSAAINHMKSANSLLTISKTVTNAPSALRPTALSEKEPHNKNIIKQNGVFSTKKKREKKNVRFGKATLTEKISFHQHALHGKEDTSLDHSYSTVKRVEREALPNACTGSSNKANLNQQLSPTTKKFITYVSSKNTLQAVTQGHLITEQDIHMKPEDVPDDIINLDFTRAKRKFNDDSWLAVRQILDVKRTEWSCALCDIVTTHHNMVECEKCNKWFHWSCANVNYNPSDTHWFCAECSAV